MTEDETGTTDATKTCSHPRPIRGGYDLVVANGD
jgi:hypothetical protein